MTKSKNLKQKPNSRIHALSLRKLSPNCKNKKPRFKSSEKKEWNNALCSVCLEFPHNAVLLLCSSYENGCRPYMCATSHRYSNCLEQYKKAYTKVTSNKLGITNHDIEQESRGPDEKPDLLCPLCRGQVKGWTVLERARGYFNRKKRTCTQDNCSFVGPYRELRKHVKSVHPLARPRDVDPTHAEKWKKLENERDMSDVFSTIQSTMPGAIVVGDYVIERNTNNYRDDFFNLHQTYDDFESDYDSLDEEDFRRSRIRALIASRSVGSRPHARLLFGRRRRAGR